MKKYLIPLLSIFLFAGCKPDSLTERKEKEEAKRGESQIDDFGPVIGKGLDEQFNLALVPEGPISIFIGGEIPPNNRQPREFPERFLTHLQNFKRMGILDYHKIEPEPQRGMIKVTGVVPYRWDKYDVVPTEKGRKLRYPDKTNPEGFYLKVGDCKVKSILKVSPYGSTTDAEELSLVQGTYELISPDWFLSERTGSNHFKFRTVLRRDIFNQKWIYVKSDWGIPEESEWKTRNVE